MKKLQGNKSPGKKTTKPNTKTQLGKGNTNLLQGHNLNRKQRKR